MNFETIRSYCLSKKGAVEDLPFDEFTLVYKVGNKMFALSSLTGELSINLKCDPEKALELREQYPAVQPGYHMNKDHWNTVYIDGSIASNLIFQWIDHSYDLVFGNFLLQ
ncbi:MAG: MmcQ/YjbR family DNA-binding protein [Bacteroidales bacterium]|nr:MmcQ/YjbR family DNA-binding protein [Bacteroidales bacterium]